MARRQRRIALALVLTLVLGAALAPVVGRFVLRYEDRHRAEFLQGATVGSPFQQVDGALCQRGRRATAEEANALAFDGRPPQGRYAYYLAGILMIRVDQKDGVVMSVEAEKVEYK